MTSSGLLTQDSSASARFLNLSDWYSQISSTSATQANAPRNFAKDVNIRVDGIVDGPGGIKRAL